MSTPTVVGTVSGMSGIAALAAAAEATSTKVVNAANPPTIASVGALGPQQTIKVLQPGGQLITTIGGQTVRLATAPMVTASLPAGSSTAGVPVGVPAGATFLKAAPGGTATLTTQGGKQIILQKQGGVGPGQSQIVTLFKTPQGMQVATMPKGAMLATTAAGSPKVTGAAGPQLIQGGPKTVTGLPQGATIVKLVNTATGQAATATAAAGTSPTVVSTATGAKLVKTLTMAGGGGGIVTMAAKPVVGGMVAAGPAGMVATASGSPLVGKPQTIVLNKAALVGGGGGVVPAAAAGATTLTGAQGQQIIVVSSAGGLKTVGSTTTAGLPVGSISGAGPRMIVVSSAQLAASAASARATATPVTIQMPSPVAGKTLTLVQPSSMVASSAESTSKVAAAPRPVSSDADLAQLAAEVGLTKGKDQGSSSGGGDPSSRVDQSQVDGSPATPDVPKVEDMFLTQVDGEPGGDDDGNEGEAAPEATTDADDHRDEEALPEAPQSEAGAEADPVAAEDGADIKHEDEPEAEMGATETKAGDDDQGAPTAAAAAAEEHPEEILPDLGQSQDGADNDIQDMSNAEAPPGDEQQRGGEAAAESGGWKKDALAEAMAAVTDLEDDDLQQQPPAAAAAAEAGDGGAKLEAANPGERSAATADEMDGASALAAFASSAVLGSTDMDSIANKAGTGESSGLNGSGAVSGVSSEDPATLPKVNAEDAGWFDVGIIRGSSCTVSSYYLQSGVSTEDMNVEGEENGSLHKIDLQVRLIDLQWPRVVFQVFRI